MNDKKKLFHSYDEAKAFIIDALKNKDYTSIRIYRKRNVPLWEVEMLLPGAEFCKEYIFTEREKN